MIKLQFSPPVYKTYDKGRITTCTYKCKQVHKQTKEVLNEFTVQGKAICSKQDIPDERTGRIIAESRAKLIAFKRVSCSKVMIMTYESKLDQISEFLMFQYKMKRCRERESDHLKKIIK